MPDPILPLGVALRRSLIHVAAAGGTPARMAQPWPLEPADLRRAGMVIDHPEWFCPDVRLAAWATLKAFRGEVTNIGRARALAGLPSGYPDAPGAA